jgi:hypothetical protein
MNYFVAQKYPNQKSNTITLKLVRINVPKNGSLVGKWEVINNDKTIATFNINDIPTLNSMKHFFYQMAEELKLTNVCGVLNNLDNY